MIDDDIESTQQEVRTVRAESANPTRAATSPARRDTPSFPWLPLVILLIGVLVFWILPTQMGARSVQVEFTREESSK